MIAAIHEWVREFEQDPTMSFYVLRAMPTGPRTAYIETRYRAEVGVICSMVGRMIESPQLECCDNADCPLTKFIALVRAAVRECFGAGMNAPPPRLQS
jgi:hypothetical protein